VNWQKRNIMQAYMNKQV